MNRERRLTITILGVLGLVSLAGSIVLFGQGHSTEGAAALGLTTTIVGILSPSPLSKSSVAER